MRWFRDVAPNCFLRLGLDAGRAYADRAVHQFPPKRVALLKTDTQPDRAR